jgi:hypothetical protein
VYGDDILCTYLDHWVTQRDFDALVAQLPEGAHQPPRSVHLVVQLQNDIMEQSSNDSFILCL